jgi:esterase/lipase
VQVDESVVPVDLGDDPEAFLSAEEGAVEGLRPGDGKEILWADAEGRERTPVSVIYIHGFSADRHEIDPVPKRVADALGANLFYTRLSGHGRDGAAMAEATAGAWLQDVEEALTVGAAIGERVIVLGTSTGGTLALWAAAQERWREHLGALVLVSPNLKVRDRNARLLLWPWGKAAARFVLGPERCFEPVNQGQARHWTTCYPTEALLPMMALVERVRTLDFRDASTPVLVVYSPEDEVVDPAGTDRVLARYGAASIERRTVTGSGDPGQHVLAGDLVSPGTTDSVVDMILGFLERALGSPGGDP